MQSGSSTAPRQYYYVGFLLLPFFCGSRHGSFPSPWLGLLPRGSTARAEVPPQLASVSLARGHGSTVGWYGSTALPCGSTAWLQAVLPRGLAVVPLAMRGSTAGRGLVGG